MQITSDLIRACQQSDTKSQTTFYNIYKSRLLGICRRYAQCKEEAEDMFQEAFVRIFQNIGKLEKPGAIDSWVKQITINTAINYYKKQLRFNLNADSQFYADILYNDDHLRIIDELSTEELLQLINELPDGYRLVFNLYVIDGYTHPEISEMLGISENTSKSQLFRAKEQLRLKLKKNGVISYEKYAR
jgi:RNA polymerase sigma-70 factor (ECF subfamily)